MFLADLANFVLKSSPNSDVNILYTYVYVELESLMDRQGAVCLCLMFEKLGF